MDRETATMALAVVTILAVFVAVSPLLPASGERFSEIGVLGPDQKIGGYPTTVVAGHNFSLFGYVGNHEGTVSYYQVMVKAGNQSTVISNSTSANLPPVFTHYLVLADNSSTVFPMILSMPHQGLQQRLIIELWMYNSTTSQFSYTGLYNQIWMNVTSH